MVTFSRSKPGLRASRFRSAKHKYGAMRREIDRAFRINSKEAFGRLNYRTLALFDLGDIYATMKAKSDKLEADMRLLIQHHNALQSLTDTITVVIDDFDDCQPCCTHSSHCLRVRSALLNYELVAHSPPRPTKAKGDVPVRVGS